MKIGITAEIFPPAWEGGRSVRIYETAKAMAGLGNEVHVYCHRFGDASSYEFMDGVHVHRVGFNVPSTKSYLKRFSSSLLFLPHLLTENFDVLNSNTMFPPMPTYLASRVKKTPVFLTTDGLLSSRLKKLGVHDETWLSREATILLEKLVSRLNYDAMIAVSEYVRREMIGLGVPPEKIFVVYSGVDTDFFDSIKGCADTSPSVIFIGNLLPHKRVTDLLHALKIVREEVPNVILRVVGDGPLLKTLEEEVSSLKMERNVAFLGRVSDNYKVELLKSSSCLVLPSVMESFGLVFLEGMACGKPVVSYDIPAAKEVIEDGRNGFLVPVGNVKLLAKQILEVLTDSSLARRMGNFGRRLVEERFTWEKTAERTLDVYRRISEAR